MTHKDDMQLNHDLGRLQAPAPRADLKARILAAAESTPQMAEPANDRGFNWKALTAAAACLVAVAFVGLQTLTPVDDTAEQWQVAAEESGFGELYDWVYAEEG